MKQIQISYFAILREERGLREETRKTKAATVKELYGDLIYEFGFSVKPEHLRVAINEEFRDWHTPFEENDHVVFLPPVSGG
jgi:sulfur-carrier protein